LTFQPPVPNDSDIILRDPTPVEPAATYRCH
jgi:hypothetical protein